MKQLNDIYTILLKSYSPQGWWPLLDYKGTNPTKTGSVNGYHPNDYTFPKDDNQRFEVCLGTLLTQNTNWKSVEIALANLAKLNTINAKAMQDLDVNDLKKAIKPAGYFNQKADCIKLFTQFYLELNNKTPTREELLALKGIGPETADSILLYAYKIPIFVIDAYTRRIFSAMGFIDKNAEYDEIQKFFMDNLPKDMIIYQEYHALIVEHAKRTCRPKPECRQCVLKKYCNS